MSTKIGVRAAEFSITHILLANVDPMKSITYERETAKIVPVLFNLSQVGAELLFEVFSQRYERGSTMGTSNLPFEEWPSVFRSERLTGALLDRLTHHVHLLEMNGESYRLQHSKGRRARAAGAVENQATRALATPDKVVGPSPG